MGIALIVEDVDSDFELLASFCELAPPELEAKRFGSGAEFLSWIKMVEKTKADKKAYEEEKARTGSKDLQQPKYEVELEKLKVSVLIVSNTLIGPQNYGLFEKLSQYFSTNGFLIEGKTELPVIFTAREDLAFDVTPYMKPLFENLMFKPFDKNVCIGKMDWAIRGPVATKDEQLHSEIPPFHIEVLKDVAIERVTELGFRSAASQKIATGKIAKYYLPFLDASVREGFFAKCIGCGPHPTKDEMFLVSFSFFAMNAKQIRKVRSYIEKMNAGEVRVMELPNFDFNSGEAPPATIVTVVSEDENQGNRIKDYLKASFKDFEVFSYKNMLDFQLEAIPSMAKAAFVNDDAEGPLEAEIIYDVDGATLVKTIPDVDPEKGLLGLSKKQVERLKSALLTAVEEKERGDILAYFKGANDQSKTIALRENGQTSLLTIVSSVDTEIDGRMRRKIVLRVASVEDAEKYAIEHMSKSSQTRVLFVSQRIASKYDAHYWGEIKNKLLDGKNEKISVMVAGSEQLEDHTKILQYTEFDDYFVEPFDPAYLEKKVKQMYPMIETAAVMSRAYFDIDTVIQTGVPVRLKKISELSVSMKYYRPIDSKKYRTIVLVAEDYRREEFLLRSMGFDEEKDDEGNQVFINYFNFFCLGDADNQFVRQWLNETYQYIAKEEEKKENEKSKQG